MVILLTGYVSILLVFSLFEDRHIAVMKYGFICLILFFVSVMVLTTRGSIDYAEYKRIYENASNLLGRNFDIAFNSLMFIHKKLFNNFVLFYGFIGILNVVLLCAIISILPDKDRLLFVVLYFSFIFLQKDLIQIRNAIAIKFFVLAVLFFFKKKNIFLLLFIISVFFHNSMLVFIPCFFLYKKAVSKKIIFLVFIFLLICYLYFEGLFHHFLSYDISFIVKARFITYMGFSDRDPLSMFHFIKMLCYLLLFSVLSDKLSERDNFFYWCIVIAYIVRISFCDIPFLTGRLAENLYIGELFLFMHIFRVNNKILCQKIVARVFLVLYFTINVNMLFKNVGLYKSYVSWLQFR